MAKTQPPVRIDLALTSALRHRAKGRLPQAALLCHAVLKCDPGHQDALNLLAVILCQARRFDHAVVLLRRSLALRPGDPGTLDRLGDALHAQRDFDGAIEAYGAAIAAKPGDAALYSKRATSLQAKGAFAEAAEAYRQAIALAPNLARLHFNLGVSLRQMGRSEDALRAYYEAARLRPGYGEVFLNIGNVFMDQGAAAAAVLAYTQAVVCGSASLHRGAEGGAPAKPEMARKLGRFLSQAYTSLGLALKKQDKMGAALAAQRCAIAMDPDYPDAHNNLGVVLQGLGRFDEAIAAHRRAIALRPEFAIAYSNLGVACKEIARMRDAIAAHRQAVAADPVHPKLHFNYAVSLLMAGQFPEGWKEYEWRWHGGVPALKDRGFHQPRWEGEPLEGRRLLLHAEQGYGDTLQFVRFARQAAAQGGRIVLEAPSALVPLLQGAPGVASVVAYRAPLPDFDVYLPLMSLPHVLRLGAEDLGIPGPYLQADPARRRVWRERLAGRASAGLRVGVVWSGNAKHSHDRHRSIPAVDLLPRLTMAGLQLFSLQKVIRDSDRAAVEAAGEGLTDLSEWLGDFADTAAAVAELDLVITVDTAVAHLAGALGCPVWTLLPFSLDWRWGLTGDDCPWYPSMRLFRQPARGDWASAIARLQAQLIKAVMTGNVPVAEHAPETAVA